jgi:RimJ/RimL family protein N-acetyltransferase
LYRSQNIIESARLNLRELELHDAQFMLELLNEAGFLRFIGDKGVRTLEDAREYILKGPIDSYRNFGFGLYLTSLRKSAAPIGICGLVKRAALPDVDVGFAFLARYWSKGYAAEAAAAVLAYGRNTLGIGRIVAITAPDNHGSIAVLEKIGLRIEGRVKLAEDGAELMLFGPPAP